MFNNRISVTVPSTTATSKKISKQEHQERLSEVLQVLGQFYGGGTATEGVGSWYSEELGQVIQEKVFIVNSYCTSEAVSKYSNELKKCLELWRKEWGQEAIALEINGTMSFI